MLFVTQPLNKSSSGSGKLLLFDVGVGFIWSQYSETDMYNATASPTAEAAHVELCNITQVAMHNPK